MLEKRVEKKLKEACKARGWLCYKWSSPSHAGVPDRIIIAPGGKVAFAEVKQAGKKATPLQLHELENLRSRGCIARVVAGPEGVVAFMDELDTCLANGLW